MTRPAEYVLHLVPVRDPLMRTTGESRDPAYRLRGALKVLLRSFGLRCVRVSPAGIGDELHGLAAELRGSNDPLKSQKVADLERLGSAGGKR